MPSVAVHAIQAYAKLFETTAKREKWKVVYLKGGLVFIGLVVALSFLCFAIVLRNAQK
jgi:hypothetical protein